MKQTEIGLIPEDWEVKSLGEIGEPCMCKRILKEQTSPTGDIPFYKIGTFGGIPDAYISRELFEQYKEQYNYPKKGTLLLSAAGTIGRVVVFDGKDSYFQDSNIVWIDNDETKVTNDFLFYCYSRMQWKTEEGGIVSRLYNANLKSTSFIAPKSLAEQQRIAKALSDVDALISTTEKLIQKKKNIKQGAMQNLLTGKKRLPGFGDKQTDLFVPNGTHTKEVKDVSPEQIRLSAKMKQTELGEIPEDWEVKGFGAYASIVRGGSPRPIQNFLTTNSDGINWIKIGDVKPEDKYIVSTEEKIIPGGKSRSREVHKGDFILSNSMSFGRPYILQIDGCIHDGWLAIQNYQDTFDTDFLYYLLGSDEIFQQYIEMAAGSSVQNLNKEKVAKLLVPIFDKKEQTAIANVLSSMDKEIETLNVKLEKYRNLKTAMMQQLLTGKIRL